MCLKKKDMLTGIISFDLGRKKSEGMQQIHGDRSERQVISQQHPTSSRDPGIISCACVDPDVGTETQALTWSSAVSGD